MPHPSRVALLRYGMAVLSVILATLARLALDHPLGDRAPFPIFFVAVVVAAWYGGLGPALLAVALSSVAAALFFVPPRGQLVMSGLESWISLILFTVVGVVVALLSDRLQAAQLRAEAAAGEALVQQEQLRVTLASIGDAVITTDTRGRVTFLNPVAQALTGWTVEEAHGAELEKVFAILNEQSLQPVENPARRALHEGLVVGLANHTVLVGRGGTRRPIDDSAAPIRDEQGNVLGAVLVFRDVSARRRAEQVARFLAEASAALASLVDYESTLQKVAGLAVPFFADWCAVDLPQPDGSLRRLAVAHVDPEKVRLVHELNRRWPLPPDAPHGPPLVFRTGRPELLEEVPDAVLAEVAQDEEHLRLLRALGLRSILCVPLEARGKVLGVLSFATSESGRRLTAEDLTLARDLAGRAAIALDNARLYAEAKEADRRKEVFLAMLAHELRNPLAPIQNALYLLQEDAGRETLDLAREIIGRQVEQLVRLVDDLLDISRILRGKIELRRERIELSTIIARAVETARPLIDAHGHELTVVLPSQPVFLDADPMRLAQVLTNLLNNSARYTPDGGHIWLAAEVTSGGRESPEEVVLRVRDTGIGIPPEVLPHVFDLFSQVDPSLGRAPGGLGVGLALVKSLVELHGGRVQAFSKGRGQGSEFIVRLSLSRTADCRMRIEEGINSRALTRGPRRILVVDDNVDAASSLALMLRLQGHEVRVAHGGEEALAQAESFLPDVAVLDLGMPGMDGYDLARRLRQLPGLENILLAALTGWGQEDYRRRSREAGFDYHLVKPADPRALGELLAQGQRTHQ